MKLEKCFVFLFFINSVLYAQILNETFESTALFTTSESFFSNGDRTYFGIAGDIHDFGNGPIPSGLKEYDGFVGNYLTGMRLNGMGAELPVQILWENINIQGVSQLIFKGDFAEFVDEPGHIDANDYILVEYQIDNQGYRSLLSFVGADFSTPSHNGVFREDTNFNGIGDGQALDYQAQRFIKNIAEIGDRMDIRISISVNAHEEDFAIDNIILTGTGVVDNTPPVIFCNEDLEVYSDFNYCGAIVEFSTPKALDETDENPIITQIEGPISGSFFEIGTTEVVFKATDSSGNSTTCSFYVHIIDKQFPQVVCTTEIHVDADPHSCQTYVLYDMPSISDNCSAIEDIEIELMSGLGSGNYFPVGKNYETYLITDAAGNMSACMIMIKVEASMTPQLNCPEEPIRVQVNNSGQYLLPKLDGRFGVELDDYCNQKEIYTSQIPAPGSLMPLGLHEVEIILFENEQKIDSCTVEVSVEESLGIDIIQEKEISFYPNPTEGKVYIHPDIIADSIKIYTINGKLLKEATQVSSISLEDLFPGLYLMEVRLENTLVTYKIVKN